MAWLIGGKYLN